MTQAALRSKKKRSNEMNYNSNGTFTILSKVTGQYRTFRVRTKRDETKTRFLSVKEGNRWKVFALVAHASEAPKIFTFKRLRAAKGQPPTKYERYAMFMEHVMNNESKMLGLVEIDAEVTCRMCNRKLTTPESIAAGIGPDCAGRQQQYIKQQDKHDHGTTREDAGESTPTKRKTVKCERCRGTGRYEWGTCVNGKMTHSGQCYRCEGKGVQTDADQRRNYGYDNHAIRRAFA